MSESSGITKYCRESPISNRKYEKAVTRSGFREKAANSSMEYPSIGSQHQILGLLAPGFWILPFASFARHSDLFGNQELRKAVFSHRLTRIGRDTTESIN